LIRRQRDPVFRAAYQSADLIVPDGMPVVWSARLAGRPVAERVTGIDLLYGLCQRARASGYKCFLLGAQQETVEAEADNLLVCFTVLFVCVYELVFFELDEPVVASINCVRPDFLVVGMGSPRQENWLQRNLSKLSCRLALPVGGALEVIAGRRSRAPKWLQ